MNLMTEKNAAELIKSKLSRYFGVSPKEATKEQVYKSDLVEWLTDNVGVAEDYGFEYEDEE